MKPTLLPAAEVLDREFLAVRAKLLEIAAVLDRFDRGAGDVTNDPRMQKIREALEVLHSDAPDRAERIQRIFSREYDENWRETFGLGG